VTRIAAKTTTGQVASAVSKAVSTAESKVATTSAGTSSSNSSGASCCNNSIEAVSKPPGVVTGIVAGADSLNSFTSTLNTTAAPFTPQSVAPSASTADPSAVVGSAAALAADGSCA